MILRLSFIALAAAVPLAKAESSVPGVVPRGLRPALAPKYQPDNEGSWKCLNSEKVIPWSAVNDDYCDCPDGSDEPGTSACPTSTFHCKNEGHIPSDILSSRVNDGICDPECCDGSDEYESWVTCPNTCQEIGKKHKAEVAAATKIRKTGSKIRSTYIAFAKTERVRLAAELTKLEKEVQAKEVEVMNAKVRLERFETQDKELLEKRQKSPIYLSFLSHREALRRLRAQTAQLQADLDVAKGILKDLSEGYNPNYQDMAVKAAVVGYEEAFHHSGPGKEGEEVDAEGEKVQEGEKEQEGITDGELDELERVDLVGLLMAGDDDGDVEEEDESDSALYRIDQYIPDALYEPYESARDFMLEWLVKFGILGRGAQSAISNAEAPHTSTARAAYNDLNNKLGQIQNDLHKTRESVEKLDVNFGPQAEWKKLENTCVEREQGGYVYSLCFFGQATQKSTRDSSTVQLGSFDSWSDVPGVKQGSEAYYEKQIYLRGARCWNGPERSVKVDLSCGIANELLFISEPEKCEYFFRATTPALCWPDLSWEKERADKKAASAAASTADSAPAPEAEEEVVVVKEEL